jgi:hypothetical protein
MPGCTSGTVMRKEHSSSRRSPSCWAWNCEPSRRPQPGLPPRRDEPGCGAALVRQRSRSGRGIMTRQAPPAALRPCRATAAAARNMAPRPAWAGAAQQSATGRVSKGGSSLRRLILKPRKFVVKGTPTPCRFAIPSGPWTTILGRRSSGAYRADARV